MDDSSAQTMHDYLLGQMPEGVVHPAAGCPLCTPHAVPQSEAAENTNPEGGTSFMGNETLSPEAHQALLDKALQEAGDQSRQQLDVANAKCQELQTDNATLQTDNATLRADVTKLEEELDTAQIAFKAAKDQIKTLKDDIAAREDQARLAEVASARAGQVTALGLFDASYVADKAPGWAALPDQDWASRLEEWAQLRPAVSASSETASAMTGTSEALTTVSSEQQPTSAAHAVLGLE